jgi:hypothetical protein
MKKKIESLEYNVEQITIQKITIREMSTMEMTGGSMRLQQRNATVTESLIMIMTDSMRISAMR